MDSSTFRFLVARKRAKTGTAFAALALVAAATLAVRHTNGAQLQSKETAAAHGRLLLAAGLALVGVLWFKLGRRRGAPTEFLTVLPLLGLLIGSSRSPSSDRFIPLAHISKVIVNEALEGFGVRSYLGVVLREGKEVVVVFPNCRISMTELEMVHEEVQRSLWKASSPGQLGLDVNEEVHSNTRQLLGHIVCNKDEKETF